MSHPIPDDFVDNGLFDEILGIPKVEMTVEELEAFIHPGSEDYAARFDNLPGWTASGIDRNTKQFIYCLNMVIYQKLSTNFHPVVELLTAGMSPPAREDFLSKLFDILWYCSLGAWHARKDWESGELTIPGTKHQEG